MRGVRPPKSCLGVGHLVGLLVSRVVKTQREHEEAVGQRREINERRGRAKVSLHV